MDEILEPVKNRRRSSILQRHPQGDIPLPVDTESSENKECGFKIPRFDSLTVEDETTLEGLIKDLETEKASWKTLLKERKTLKESAKSCNTKPRELSWNTARDFLTEDDIAFLKDEPPFEKIADDFDKLVKRVAISRVKYERVSALATRTTQLAHFKIKNIKRNIAEYSDKTMDVVVSTV